MDVNDRAVRAWWDVFGFVWRIIGNDIYWLAEARIWVYNEEGTVPAEYELGDVDDHY